MRHRKLLIFFTAVALAVLAGSWQAGTMLIAPVQRFVGPLPAGISGENIEFQSDSGAKLHGWALPGRPNAGVIVLLHGVRASRLDMFERARFLHRAGFGVVLFDFQGHGESLGHEITFGARESFDASAAIAFTRAYAPGEKVGALGVSQGGAAVLLATPPLPIDAVLLEQVYPTIKEAIGNRLAMRFGSWSPVLTPLLSWQLSLRLGVSARTLRPRDGVAGLKCPKLFVAGAADEHTTLAQSEALFAEAKEPKELWVLRGAKHVDLHRFAPDEYERRVTRFFSEGLSRSSP